MAAENVEEGTSLRDIFEQGFILHTQLEDDDEPSSSEIFQVMIINFKECENCISYICFEFFVNVISRFFRVYFYPYWYIKDCLYIVQCAPINAHKLRLLELV